MNLKTLIILIFLIGFSGAIFLVSQNLSKTEDLGNAAEKQDLIRVLNPQPNELIKSPFTVRGQARGFWFFEASFPIKLIDENGNELGTTIAQAITDWMTEEFVPFKAILIFQPPQTKKGTIIFKKDNPSGLPEYDDELIVPVKFNK